MYPVLLVMLACALDDNSAVSRLTCEQKLCFRYKGSQFDIKGYDMEACIEGRLLQYISVLWIICLRCYLMLVSACYDSVILAS